MSWVRLDDGAPGHRKIVGLSDAAFRLWVVGLTYCNQQANDGRFSAASARIMTGYLASPELGRDAMAELCAAGLWAETADGFEVHDYLEYQPSQEERASANRAAAERMRDVSAARPGQEKDRGAVFCLTSVSACGTHHPMWKGKCEVFKRRLAAVLAVRGMGQREFATFCKVTPRAVRNWLSGRPPSPTVFALISSAWGEDTFLYLIGDINRMPEPQPEPVRVAKEG